MENYVKGFIAGSMTPPPDEKLTDVDLLVYYTGYWWGIVWRMFNL